MLTRLGIWIKGACEPIDRQINRPVDLDLVIRFGELFDHLQGTHRIIIDRVLDLNLKTLTFKALFGFRIGKAGNRRDLHGLTMLGQQGQ